MKSVSVMTTVLVRHSALVLDLLPGGVDVRDRVGRRLVRPTGANGGGQCSGPDGGALDRRSDVVFDALQQPVNATCHRKLFAADDVAVQFLFLIVGDFLHAVLFNTVGVLIPRPLIAVVAAVGCSLGVLDLFEQMGDFDSPEIGGFL